MSPTSSCAGVRRATAGLALLAATLFAACGDDPLSPRDVAGTYAYIGTTPINPVLDQVPWEDTVVLDAAGTGTRVRRLAWSTVSGSQESRSETPLQYHLEGRTIYVTLVGVAIAGSRDVAGVRGAATIDGEAPRPTVYVPGPHYRGTFTSRGLLLAAVSAPSDTLWYERVPGSPR